MKRLLVTSVLVSSFILHAPSFAQAPALIHYQGRLLQGTNLVNGTVSMSLRLFNTAAAGSLLYEDSNSVTVVDGLYSTFIGDNPTNNAFLAAFTNAALYVEVAVNGSTLLPRERLASVGYSLATRGMLAGTNGTIVLNAVSGTNSIHASSVHSSIGGGLNNNIRSNAFWSAIGGGQGNDIHALASFIGGGVDNNIYTNAYESAILGGVYNDILVNASFSCIGGGYNNVIGSNAFMSAIMGGTVNDIRPNASLCFIGGGTNNNIGTNAALSVIAGGEGNEIFTDAGYSLIGGGFFNFIDANANVSVIAGGGANRIFDGASYSFIGGGYANNIDSSAYVGVIAGGEANNIGAGAFHAFIGGGSNNSLGATALYAVIPGGRENSVGSNATNAFAAGRQAKSNHRGAFVWGDDTGSDVASSANNQVTFRASGGYRVFTSGALTSGVQVAANSGSWTTLSDVNAKEDFDAVDTAEVLKKVAQLPITTWRYKSQDQSIRHMGPTAQDFAAAFGLGDLPGAGITTVDADGVAFAAIQALQRENAALRSELAAIKERMAALEHTGAASMGR